MEATFARRRSRSCTRRPYTADTWQRKPSLTHGTGVIRHEKVSRATHQSNPVLDKVSKSNSNALDLSHLSYRAYLQYMLKARMTVLTRL